MLVPLLSLESGCSPSQPQAHLRHNEQGHAHELWHTGCQNETRWDGCALRSEAVKAPEGSGSWGRHPPLGLHEDDYGGTPRQMAEHHSIPKTF